MFKVDCTKRIHLVSFAALVMSLFLPNSTLAGTAVRHHDRRVEGRFMVLLAGHVPADAYDGVVQSLVSAYGITIGSEWREEPRGFVTVSLTNDAADRLVRDPRVAIVEEDCEIPQPYLSSVMNTTVNVGGPWTQEYLWHLDRIDERTYVYDNTYRMCPTGDGTDGNSTVVAYLIDQGVLRTHPELTGRIDEAWFFDPNAGHENGDPDNTDACTLGTNPTTQLWHGTATASILGGANIGASRVKIVSLRPTTCLGSLYYSSMVNAVRWIRGPYDTHASMPGVVSMSMWLGTWDTGWDTVNLTIDSKVRYSNIPFIVSAGNFSGDACDFSPANMAYTNMRVGTVFSVGGTSQGSYSTDPRWQTSQYGGIDSGSNGGSCVSIYAPAANIFHAVNDPSPNARYDDTYSGTSFSAPIVAAIAARYLASHPSTSYTSVYNYLLSNAGSALNMANTSTSEYWMCYKDGEYTPYPTNPGTCSGGGYLIHVPATTNSSNAGMLFSGMQCP